MKSDIHPQNYRPVVFQDAGSGAQFIIGSTVATDQTTKVDGKEYPLYIVEISSASHPFYTGKSTTIDRAGRVDRFKKRSAARASKK
jgi:large subunit ribosomal protein L31